jgi:Ca2+-binding RTX toxin-like protein
MTLVGSMDNNTIIGGAGSSDILWGGAGDNLLIGGLGEDIFVYAKDSRDYIEGAEALEEASHDIIANYDADNDTIFLGDITLDDIDIAAMADSADGGIGEDSVTVRFKNGGTLTVAGTQEETKFNLADGSVYTATRSTNSWS